MKFEEFDEKIVVIDNKIKSFIYFLIKNNEVVYIGKTENGFVRPFSHKDKDFDLVISIPTDKQHLNPKEQYLIKKYNPIYNTTFAKYKKNLTLFELVVPKIKNLYFSRITRIDIDKLKKFAYSNGIEKQIIKKREYVDWGHLKGLLDLNRENLSHLIVDAQTHKNKIHINENDVIKFNNKINEQQMISLGYSIVDGVKIFSKCLNKNERKNIKYQKIIARGNEKPSIVIEISNNGDFYIHYQPRWSKDSPVKRNIEKYVQDLINAGALEIKECEIRAY